MQYVRVHRGSLDLSAIRWRRCFFVADPLKLPTARDFLCTTRRRDYQCAQIEAQPPPLPQQLPKALTALQDGK